MSLLVNFVLYLLLNPYLNNNAIPIELFQNIIHCLLCSGYSEPNFQIKEWMQGESEGILMIPDGVVVVVPWVRPGQLLGIHVSTSSALVSLHPPHF